MSEIRTPGVPGPILQDGERPDVVTEASSWGTGQKPPIPANPYYQHAMMMVPIIDGALPIAGTSVVQLPAKANPIVALSQESTGVRFNFGFPIEWFGEQGIPGHTPVKDVDYFDGAKGDQGDSAYQVWLLAGNNGTVADYLNSLKGASDAAEVSILDNAGYFDSDDVEGALQELGLAMQNISSDAEDVSIADTADNFTATDVEAALAELATSKAPVDHTHSYQAADADLLAIAGLVGNTGLLKKIGADTWALDTNSYALDSHHHDAAYLGLTAKAADSDKLNGQLASAYALSEHNHDTAYSAAGHNHDSAYAASGHNHDATYWKLADLTFSLNGTTLTITTE